MAWAPGCFSWVHTCGLFQDGWGDVMCPTSHVRQLRIGGLAAELGLNPKTLGYYEEISLLPAPRRTSSGHRLLRHDRPPAPAHSPRGEDDRLNTR
ncbi:MAG TPA: MerR family DNA-binding transcriptional regulator [Candidatus Tectomicrobia bacterium]